MAIDTDTRLSDLFPRLGDLLVDPTDARLSEALTLVGTTLGGGAALWWGSGSDGRVFTSDNVGDPDAIERRAAEWLSSLDGTRVLDIGGLEEGPALGGTGRIQVVHPLTASGTDGVLVIEGEHQPSTGELTSLVQLVRLALVLRRMRADQATAEAAQLQALRSQQELMGHIVDALPVGLYVVDRDYRIVAWNRKRETGTQGVAREDAIGRSVFDVLYRQPEEQLREEFEEVFRAGEIRHYDVESTASGERRHYRLTKVPMKSSGSSEVTHVITIGEDVTERKRISERISHAEKLAALGQMAAGVMHEINNPLATIAACAEALADLVEDDEPAEMISMIDTEVDRCKRIARDLLAFSRPQPSEKGPVDVQETVEETLRLLRHHDRFKKIRVQREYVYDLPLVWANSERLIQVFVALALNALDAMEEDGELRVRTEILEEDEQVAVSFIDTGCGIPPSELPKIFEPFYTSKPPGKGTGLGLSICYGIIAEHGGRIEVDSTLDVGSNFRVVLPTQENRASGSSPGPAEETGETVG